MAVTSRQRLYADQAASVPPQVTNRAFTLPGRNNNADFSVRPPRPDRCPRAGFFRAACAGFCLHWIEKRIAFRVY